MEYRKLLHMTVTLLFIPFLSSCNPYSAIGVGLELVGTAASMVSSKKGDSANDNSTATFAPGIDTEQTARQVLDEGGGPQNVMVLSNNTPVCKILFYKRGDLIHPILFTYDEEKKVFVYQAMRGLKKKEFDKKKDTSEYRKHCEEWYSFELVKRANQYEKKGLIDLAYRSIQQIEGVRPIGAKAYNGVAWFYATCPDPKYRNAEKAVAFAKKSVSLERHISNLDTLAAAYAEGGDFDRAVKFQEEAMRTCTNEQNKVFLGERLAAYRDQKTYIQREEENKAALIAKDSGRITEMWCGELRQSHDYSYPIEMRLTEVTKGAECGSIIYPTLGCGGTLTCVDIQANKYLFREEMKFGPCVRGGTIHAVKTDTGALKWQWVYPDGKKGSEGTLYLSD